MGMFNYVKFKDKCPSCGEELDNYQTKHGDDLNLKVVNPWDVSEFHTNCGNCWTRVEYVLGYHPQHLCESNYLEYFDKYVEKRSLHLGPQSFSWPSW